jgi:citrate synthase
MMNVSILILLFVNLSFFNFLELKNFYFKNKNMESSSENLETGLRGVAVGYCTTSTVDPYKGLSYRGHLVSTLDQRTAEEVIYLLYYGKEPTEQELRDFKELLVERSRLQPAVIQAIEKLPKQGHPMALYACAILILGMYEGTGDYKEDALNVIAKIPTLTAHVINYHGGLGLTPKAEPNRGYIENFTHLLQCPKSHYLLDVMRLFNVLHYDHGGGNLSTFVGKAVASGLEDMYGSLAAAMNALAGPRHGRANQECLHFTEELMKACGPDPSLSKVEAIIANKLANKELIYGFGHAVLRVEDPRASVLYDYAQKHFPSNPLIEMALKIRVAGSHILKQNPKVADPYPNVDAISGSLLMAAGFPYPEYYTLLFGMSRIVGIAIQIVYERCEARDGKGTPIIRPKYIYKGPTVSGSDLTESETG